MHSAKHFRAFEILEKIGMVVYILALPPCFSSMFHASMFQKYLLDPSHVFEEDSSHEVQQERVVDKQIRNLLSKKIDSVK